MQGAASAPPPPAPMQQAAPRQAAPRPAPQQVRFADDTDALARTILGEAGNQGENGMLAVGGVVMNRARSRNMTPSQVVLERNQFEPWGNPQTTNRLLSIRPDSPEYQRAYAIAQRAMAGEDPTGGADHFYAPRAQAAMGRRPPSWAQGDPLVIGDHNFYNLGGSTEDFRQTAAAAPQMAAAPPPPPEGFVMDGQAAGAPAAATQAPGASRDSAIDLTGTLYEDQVAALKQGAWVRAANGEVYQLPGDAYTAQPDSTAERQSANVYLDRPDMGDKVDAFAQAAGEQIPFLDEAAAGVAGAMTGRGYSAMRDQQDLSRRLQNQTERGSRVAGGLAGFGLGLAAPGGSWIAQGPNAAYRASRAAAVGAGLGGLYGAGAAEGGLPERAQAAGLGAATGAFGGAAFSGAGDVFGGIARRALPDAPRRLSRQGIDLTPGQMASSIPLVGTTAKYLEDVAGGFNPLMTGVRQRQNEQVIRAAGNEALSAIGAQLPRNARTGYQVSQGVMETLGQAYDDILPRVQAQADPEFSSGLRDMVSRASETLDDSRFGRLNRILNDQVVNRFAEDGALTGEQFKRIETTLRQQSERANRPNSTLEDQDLSEFLDEARNIVRDMIARQNPAEAERIQAINRGYAVGKRIQRSVSGAPQAAREGTPTPGELTNTVRQMSSDSQMSNQTALLQGLASDARSVLPSSVGDTGSGQKAVLGGMAVLGTTGAAAINPALGAGIIGGAAAYSKPGIALMNMLYRATDRPGASAEALSRLANLARQNPALVPVYERALLQGQLSGEPRSQLPSPAARGLFGARRPQMAPQ